MTDQEIKAAEISAALKEFLCNDLCKKDIDVNKSFAELGIDSMALLRIILFLEERFKVNITDNLLTIEHLKDINSLSNLVAILLKDK